MKTITLVIFLISFVLMGCNPAEKTEKGDLQFFTVEAKDFESYINQKQMPERPDLTSDKTLLNRDYPIEIALYSDGRWFYDLPNLDTGKGTWKLENGRLKLFAKQRLFDMHIDVVAIKANAKDVIIKFSDRFGPRILNTEKVNFVP